MELNSNSCSSDQKEIKISTALLCSQQLLILIQQSFENFTYISSIINRNSIKTEIIIRNETTDSLIKTSCLFRETSVSNVI